VEIFYLVVPHTLDDYVLQVLEDKAQASVSVNPTDTAGVYLTGDLTPFSETDGESDLDAICKVLEPLLEAA
jgi:hypothetical protein